MTVNNPNCFIYAKEVEVNKTFRNLSGSLYLFELHDNSSYLLASMENEVSSYTTASLETSRNDLEEIPSADSLV